MRRLLCMTREPLAVTVTFFVAMSAYLITNAKEEFCAGNFAEKLVQEVVDRSVNTAKVDWITGVLKLWR